MDKRENYNSKIAFPEEMPEREFYDEKKKKNGLPRKMDSEADPI